MNFDLNIFLQYALHPSHTYLYGLWLTCIIALTSVVLGAAIGMLAALCRMSANRLFQYPVRFYIWVIRGTPLLVQILFLYTALAAGNVYRFEDIYFGEFVLPGNIQAAIVALSISEGAFMAEIIRAGLLSIDKGQYEAAKALGMTYPRLMRRIIFPQSMKVIIPGMGNQVNVLLKNTTLVSVIGVPELMLSTQMITSATFRVFELYLLLTIYFLILTSLWSLVQRRLEQHYARSERFTDPA
ncbi:amino acid ABC transporter permease [Pantoea cypripedii]|uniref:Amino acid ABC transporter permease n=1 Tax=Pantoea cypripedii TaxID=55209 RepID=A0A6B9G7E1_PANCY|nr:amino acid ABC transporter permease [Pantoea cypripedii]QGY33058.1 amino acid ABC transporter permease [Pantoea cypripedii]